MAQLIFVVALTLLPGTLASRFMNCGPSVPLCGVLTLESGFGAGTYHHTKPTVHGLWPQVGRFGSSQCIRPAIKHPTRTVYSCYMDDGTTQERILSFERHEWLRHGSCAGAHDEDDFFQQVCSLSRLPLQIMGGSGGKTSFKAMVAGMRKSGLPLYAVDYRNKQIELSVCASHNGRWKFAPPSRFSGVCGPEGTTSNGTDELVCKPGRHGPRCHDGAGCVGLAGCKRCAHSGFCTAEPLI